MKTPEIFIPLACRDRPGDYWQAQERMWGLNARRDVLRRIIHQVDSELEATTEEARELLKEFPTLSLQARKL